MSDVVAKKGHLSCVADNNAVPHELSVAVIDKGDLESKVKSSETTGETYKDGMSIKSLDKRHGADHLITKQFCVDISGE